MKQISILICLSIGICSISFAQVQDTKDQASLKGFALQFGMNTPINQPFLSAPYGALISGKFGVSPTIAIKLGLTANFNKMTDYYQDGTTYSSGSFSANINAYLIKYLSIINPIKPYLGIGLTYGVTYRNLSENFLQGDACDIGALTSIGAEWFVAHGLSLFAEYSTTFEYAYTANPPPNSSSSYTNPIVYAGSWIIKPNAVLVGLSFYFN